MLVRFRQMLGGHFFDLLLLAGLAVTVWRLASRPPSTTDIPSARLVPESILTLPGFAWPSREQNIVVAIQTFCPGCNHSVSFYRKLAQTLRDTAAPLVVLAQEDETTVKAWLQQHQIDASTVVIVPRLAAVGVVVTPTIMRVTGTGKITDIVSGVLNPLEETRLLDRAKGIGNTLQRLTYARFVYQRDLDAAALPGAIFLDVRERSAYAQSHRAGAVNIPHDEVEARAAIELSLVRPVIVDCLDTKFSRCEIAGEALIRQGAIVSILLPNPTPQ